MGLVMPVTHRINIYIFFHIRLVLLTILTLVPSKSLAEDTPLSTHEVLNIGDSTAVFLIMEYK